MPSYRSLRHLPASSKAMLVPVVLLAVLASAPVLAARPSAPTPAEVQVSTSAPLPLRTSMQTSASPASATATDSTARAYDRREPAAGHAEKFRGGGTSIYIGGSTLAVALLIVLLIVLL